MEKKPKLEENLTTENKKVKLDNNPKVKSVSKIPQQQANSALLCLEISRRWANNHAQWQTPFADAGLMQREGQTLATLLQEVDANETSKKRNTQALKDANLAINKAVSKLKAYIKTEYDNSKDWDEYFKEYGLEPNKNNIYILLSDNALRQVALQKLINKLQEPNNPFANRSLGLAQWQNLQRTHNQLWEESNDLRGNRSSLTPKVGEQYAKIQELLKKLLKYIDLSFNKEQATGLKRSLGFLKESF